MTLQPFAGERVGISLGLTSATGNFFGKADFANAHQADRVHEK
jgi:hypothetical protein